MPLNRKNDDLVKNSYGNIMIDFCKNTNLFIMNSRLGNVETNVHVTCEDRRTKDCFLCTTEILNVMQDLEVHGFNTLFSDAHSSLTVKLNINNTTSRSHEHFSGNAKEKKV